MALRGATDSSSLFGARRGGRNNDKSGARHVLARAALVETPGNEVADSALDQHGIEPDQVVLVAAPEDHDGSKRTVHRATTVDPSNAT